MKIKDIIQQLQKYPDDTEVKIFEQLSSDPASPNDIEGVYHDIKVDLDTSYPGGAIILKFQSIIPDPETDPFKELTDLQLQYGYERGVLSPVALLGLFGEAGEVLDEVKFMDRTGDLLTLNTRIESLRNIAVSIAIELDFTKKIIRKNSIAKSIIISTEELDGGNAFDIEVADLLYYINLVALGRGRDLSYYAELSCRKVIAKSLNSLTDE
jgi:hypothetical protein